MTACRVRECSSELVSAKATIAKLSARTSDEPTVLDRSEFSTAYPSHQAALDLFQWTSGMPIGSGLAAGPNHQHFSDDRVMAVASRLGGLAGKTIIELGPYEAYNTYQFEGMGAASVVSIENSRENFLKCLVVKNAFGLRSTFLHGDMIKYLDGTHSRWDICWASGVLYHMSDPIALLQGIAKVSKCTFVWTQYYDPDRASEPGVAEYFDASRNKTVKVDGRDIVLLPSQLQSEDRRVLQRGQPALLILDEKG